MQTQKRNKRNIRNIKNKKRNSRKTKRGGILISSIKDKYDPMVKERNRLLYILDDLEKKLKKCNQVGGSGFLNRFGYTTSTEYNKVKSETLEIQKQIENLEKAIKECQEHKEKKQILQEEWKEKMDAVFEKSNSSSIPISQPQTPPINLKPIFRPALLGGIIRKTMKKRKHRKNRK
jgi:hypothetical protein